MKQHMSAVVGNSVFVILQLNIFALTESSRLTSLLKNPVVSYTTGRLSLVQKQTLIRGEVTQTASTYDNSASDYTFVTIIRIERSSDNN